jgi:hypothetical protein
MAHAGPWPPFLGVFNLIRHVVGLLWASDQLVAKACTDTGQHKHINTKANIHAPSSIRTRDPSNQAAKTYALHRAVTGTGQQ